MRSRKLTLSADAELVDEAKRWTADRNTSVSATVSRLSRALVRAKRPARKV